jgi:hypothetical protein
VIRGDIMPFTVVRLQAYRNTWDSLRTALYAADNKIEVMGERSILTAH